MSITTKVDKATSDLLIAPDWTTNMEICDAINSDLLQAKEATKAVKKRLQHKNPAVQLLALTLLETIMKNCGEYVHLQVVERNILQEMIKIVRKKSDMHVRDKILVLLGSWQEAFGGPQGKYPQYYWAYDELRRSGVEFPRHLKDAAPIFTPPVTHPIVRKPEVSYGMPSHSSRRLDEAMASERDLLSSSSLDAIQSVVELLKDMLDAISPNDPEAVKNEVIMDLVSQCHSHQKRLMQLVNSTADEELLARVLALNDSIQTLLAKHDAIARGSPMPSTPPPPSVSQDSPISSSLPPAASRQEDIDEEEEDDDFAQLARRPKGRPIISPTTSTEAAGSVNSERLQDSSGTDTASSSIFTGPLALPAPPQPVRTSVPKEQDLIDLLSTNLSTTNLSPHTPGTPFTPPAASNSHLHATSPTMGPSSFSPNGRSNPVSSPTVVQSHFSPNGHAYPISSPTMGQFQFSPSRHAYPMSAPTMGQPSYASNGISYPVSSQYYPVQQRQVAFNNYIAPWAHASSSYPPPPWSSTPVADPPYPMASEPGSVSVRPMQTSGASLQRYNSFSPRGDMPQSSRGTQMTNEPRNSVPSSSQKVFVPSNRLFEDLVNLRTDDAGVKTSGMALNSGLSGQGLSGGRK
ncbi:TOM1-like protein 6 [Nymphaea colorata]|nr:TOM1-like protein 6 [Nymphaea colorata]